MIDDKVKMLFAYMLKHEIEECDLCYDDEIRYSFDNFYVRTIFCKKHKNATAASEEYVFSNFDRLAKDKMPAAKFDDLKTRLTNSTTKEN